MADSRKDLLEKVSGVWGLRVSVEGDWGPFKKGWVCLPFVSACVPNPPNTQIIKYGGFENVARRLQLGFKS